MDEFEQLLVGLRSDQTQVRGQYEAQYETLKANSPDLLAERLAQVVAASSPTNDSSVGVLQLAAVLLRRLLENETETGAWARLQPLERKQHLKQQMLHAFAQNRQDKRFRNGIIHILAQLSRLEGESKQEWPELFHLLFECTKPTSGGNREGGFELFAQVAEYAPGLVTPHAREIGQVMASGLVDETSAEVRMASLGALSSLIVSITDPKDLEMFRPSIPVMLACLKSSLDLAVSSQNAALEETCRSAIVSLTEICTTHSKFFRGPEFAELAQSMVSIAAAKHGLEVETRAIGLEFLVSCAEQMSAFLRKEHEFSSNLLPLCMELMCELDSDADLDEWSAKLGQEDDLEEDEVLVNAAETSAHRFALALGGKTVLPKVLELVPAMLSNPDWRIRRSAIQTLSLVAEGCGKKMYAKLKEVVAFCQAMKQDPHPKVRYAVVHLLGRLCLDFGDDTKPGVTADHSQSGAKPTFQKRFAKQTLPMLSDFLRDANIRVATHSAGALVNFFIEYGDLTPEDVGFALEPLLEGLLVHLQKGTLPTKEEALVAISGISTIAGPSLFVRYYDTLMPIALAIAAEPSPAGELDEQVSQVKGRALECAGLMAVAVGKERFNATARTLIDLILPNCHSQHPDSTLRRFSLAALVRVCEVLKAEFLPVLPQLVPDLVKGCKEDITVQVIDQSKTEEYENQGFQVVQLAVRGEGNKSVSINSSAVQEISTCSFALYSFAHSLETLFAPYAPQTFEAFLPLVDCDGLETVRNCAVLGLPHLVGSMSQQPAVASEMLSVSVTTLLSKLMELENSGMESEEDDDAQFQMDIETSLHVVESLVALIQHAYQSGGARDNDPFLAKRVHDHPPAYSFGAKFPEVLGETCAALQRRVEWIVETRTNYDQEDEDRFLQRDSQHVEIAERLLDCVGYLIKLNAAGFHFTASVREHVFPLFPILLGETNVDQEMDFRRLGVCLLDDFVEFYGSQQEEPDRLLREYAIDMLIASAQSANNALCRASVWGLGICAVYAGASFSPKVKEAVQVLGHAVEVRRAKMPQEEDEDVHLELGLVVDNALSALEKIASFRAAELQAAGVPAELVVKKVIECLPPSADAEEARVLNVKMAKYLNKQEYGSLLLSQVEYGKSSISGEWNEQDSFLHPKTRMELFQMFATGDVERKPELESLLAELAAWAAKIDLSVV